MKVRIKLLFIPLIISFFCNATSQPALLIDTQGKIKHEYRNLLALARSIGFAIDYHSFYSLLSTSKIDQYETIFFVTPYGSPDILKSNLIQKHIKNMHDFMRKGNKSIAILIPGQCTPHTLKLLKQIGVPQTKQVQDALKTFVESTFLHDAKKGMLYGTTLINKTTKPLAEQSERSEIPTTNDPDTGRLLITPLPHNKKRFSPLIKKTFPIGLYIHDKKLNNSYLIAKESDFIFSEMAENFFSNPFDFDIRQKRLITLQQTLKEFKFACSHGFIPQKHSTKKAKLPKKLTKRFNFAQKKKIGKQVRKRLRNNKDYRWLFERPLACAWLAMGDYFLDEHQPPKDLPEEKKLKLKKAALERGIDFIYDSGLNLLWFEFNPESFLSKNALFKSSRQQFINRVKTIGAALKKRFAGSNKPMPKLFIGTDITSNFSRHPVHIATRDFYNRTYSKIPSPLDIKYFWKPELLDVFDVFVKELAQHIPIDGIFLDFEMYHAQKQASEYLNSMDFSDLSWKLYVKQTKRFDLLKHVSIPDRVSYLVQTNQLKKYYAFLQSAAQKLGEKIKQHVREKIPNILIGAYAQTLPRSWFYRGILAGLSSPQEPVIFATFNTDYFSHAQWLKKQEIYLLHGAPIMLSKIKTAHDFQSVYKLKHFHDFIWYNRPSRMIYPQEKRTNIWWSSEASPLPAKNLAKEIQKQTVIR